MKELLKRFFRYFFQGLILFIPLIITVFIILQVYNKFAELFSFIGFKDYPILNAALGLTGTICSLALLGMLASSYVFQGVFSLLEKKLERAPFIRHIYSPIKDFTGAFTGNKKRFTKPVLVKINSDSQTHQIGFITKENLNELGIADKVAVYLPFSYALSGRLIIVPKENVTPLDIPAAEAMKFIVSGGVTDVE
ncbi:MAG: DUF502 domain-containing protein [Bacteroidetes bacterium]|nr:DUF502 domain-containing protein [Bacteroidota bacterium]